MPKLATIRDEAEHDVPAPMSFPKEHREKLQSTNPNERLKGEISCHTEVVGIFPNAEASVRLVGALFLAQNHGWAVQRARYDAGTHRAMGENAVIRWPAVAS